MIALPPLRRILGVLLALLLGAVAGAPHFMSVGAILAASLFWVVTTDADQ